MTTLINQLGDARTASDKKFQMVSVYLGAQQFISTEEK